MAIFKTMAAIDEAIQDLQGSVTSLRDSAVKLASDKSSNMEDVRRAKAAYDDAKGRLDMLQDERARMADEAAFKLRKDSGGAMCKREAAGLFYRTALSGGDTRSLPQMAYQQLGMIPENNDDQGNGSVLVPTTLSNELLLAPRPVHPLRSKMTVTAIPNLRIPRMSFTVPDDDFLAADGLSAKEMQMRGELVSFGANEYRLKARVAESVLRTTNLNIEAAINQELDAAATRKEMKCLFATSPTTALKHMSLYQANGITEVSGADMYEAITSAWAALEDEYRDSASGVMRFSDYVKLIRSLAGDASLFAAQPKSILGVDMAFTEQAVQPVIGDWRYLHLNFACPAWYDTDKDPDKGLRMFYLNSLYDIQIKMFAAFRRAKVTLPTPPQTETENETGKS